MKVLCVIDHFGAGGAQRQMVELACALKSRGHAIEMFIYYPQYDFFRPQVLACGIPVHECKKREGSSWRVIKALASLMGRFDIVLSYLNTPNAFSEIARLISHAPKLVVSERSSHHVDRWRVVAFGRRVLHRVADRVVVNSLSHKQWLETHFHWLRGKVTTIYNGLDLASFANATDMSIERQDIRLLAIGRVGQEKNVINLVKGCHLYNEKYSSAPSITWVGSRDNSPAGRRYCKRVDSLLDSLPGVNMRWRWLGARTDIPDLLRAHHALIHPSLYEGLPNVVCEALASGRPVLLSNVCDNGLLVVDGERGFLFDPQSPESISNSIRKLVTLSDREWLRLSRNARQYAAASLATERMVSEYETLFSKLLSKSQ